MNLALPAPKGPEGESEQGREGPWPPFVVEDLQRRAEARPRVSTWIASSAFRPDRPKKRLSARPASDRRRMDDGVPLTIAARIFSSFPVPPFEAEGVVSRSTASSRDNDRIVLIRLHAFGDVAITFPVLAALRRRLPGARLTVVTDPGNAEVVRAHRAVDSVVEVDARASRPARIAALMAAAARIRMEGRPAVLDLQRNEISRALTRLVAPRRFAAFDRYAPRTALTRYLEATEAIGLAGLSPVLEPHASEGAITSARARLAAMGAVPGRPLVCLNPAGGWESKQWPLERYVELGHQLYARGWQLLALGSSPLSARHAMLREALGSRLVDLAGRTTPSEALALASLASLVISDDSGLMHLAWVQGVPAIALFGSTRSAWSRPEGPLSSGFYSEDLECGACMLASCSRGDRHCLLRVSVEDVLKRVPVGLARKTESAPGELP